MELPAVIVSVLVVLSIFYVSKAEEERCDAEVRCSTKPDTAWATDGKTCRVFRNECFLRNANCDLIKKSEPKLEQITKERCQLLCNPVCSDDYTPICGYYEEDKRTFANQCEMDLHVCTSGETYGLYRDGECQSIDT